MIRTLTVSRRLLHTRRACPPCLALVGALMMAGCGEDQPPPARDRLPAVDLDWVGGLPAGLGSGPAHGLYLVHNPDPDRSDPADPFAEIVFATTDTGYQMDSVALGPTAADEGQWLRFGIIQDLTVAPLGARYLLDDDAVHRVRVHGELDGAWYQGESTDVHVEADLATGALYGRLRVTIESPEAPSHILSTHFSGQLERDCTLWVYAPGLDVSEVEPTGGPCAPVLDAIDAAPARPDGPLLPPGFSSTSTTDPAP